MNRVWIYQANRFLLDHEVQSIQMDLNTFVDSWTAHGSALAGKALVVDNLFIVIEVDERQAGVTGCSIDKSVHFLKSLSAKYAVDFFDRLKISFLDEEGNVKLVDRQDFEQLIKSGDVKNDTIVFNNLIQNGEELTSNWKVPFKDSWHSKVF